MNYLPRSLYVHIPWCTRKCPYCDFNSHEHADPDFKAYGYMLRQDLASDLQAFDSIPFVSVFFGGGTPSLMPPEHLHPLFDDLYRQGLIDLSTEITLEANPGTLDLNHLTGYLELGVNRLSIGVQSFQSHCLDALGRVHDGNEAISIIKYAQDIGFKSINIDLMHGTPKQQVDDALNDLNTIRELEIEHLSWFPLIIEKNTIFNSIPPRLPNEQMLGAIESLGETLIETTGLKHYEISAFAKPGHEARHGLNYCEFGDYFGIGAGAHGKITLGKEVIRTNRVHHPKHYLDRIETACTKKLVGEKELVSECLISGLRLKDGISHRVFEQRTGLSAFKTRSKCLRKVYEFGLLEKHRFQTTPLGWRHLNTLLEMLV